MVVQLLTLGRLRAEERPAAQAQILALQVELLVDQEIFLLRADLRVDLLGLVVAEQTQDCLLYTSSTCWSFWSWPS